MIYMTKNCMHIELLYIDKWMNEWMMHLYSTLSIAVQPKHVTIMWGVSVAAVASSKWMQHTAASTWMMRRLPQDNCASALTTHQLQVERRESHWANQVYGDY